MTSSPNPLSGLVSWVGDFCRHLLFLFSFSGTFGFFFSPPLLYHLSGNLFPYVVFRFYFWGLFFFFFVVRIFFSFSPPPPSPLSFKTNDGRRKRVFPFSTNGSGRARERRGPKKSQNLTHLSPVFFLPPQKSYQSSQTLGGWVW